VREVSKVQIPGKRVRHVGPASRIAGDPGCHIIFSYLWLVYHDSKIGGVCLVMCRWNCNQLLHSDTIQMHCTAIDFIL